MRLIHLIAALLSLGIGMAMPVDPEYRDLATPPLRDTLDVGFVICYPNSDIYQLEGHAALHLRGTLYGQPIDQTVNYGLFEFREPNFIYKFCTGEAEYLCGTTPWPHFLNSYLAENRTIIEYPLVMDSIQKSRLVALLEENLRPENRRYRYNYVKDNCSTRPLNIIEKAMGDSIILPQPSDPTLDGTTYREILRAHNVNYPWYQFGIDLALGNGIDYPVNTREKAFAPTVLDTQLAGATIGGHPLTSGKITVNHGVDARFGPTPWYLSPNTVCWTVFVLILCNTIYDFRRRKVTRWVDAALYGIFGLAGLILTFLIFVSIQEATSPNWLYLWLNPLCLIVPIFIWLKKCKKVVISYQIINFALLLIMIAFWPLSGQSANIAFIPLIGCDLLRSISYLLLNIRHLNKSSNNHR